MAKKGFDAKKYLDANLTARWGKKKWQITESKIRSLSEASLQVEYDKSKKKKKDRWKREAKITFPLYKGLVKNLDIAGEIWEWRTLINKKHALYIGGVAFGGFKVFQLVGVEASEIQVIGGEIVQCEIELTFVTTKKAYKLKPYKTKRQNLNAQSSK